MKRFFVAASLFVVVSALLPDMAWPHAFPEKAVPGAGAELQYSPGAVTIRFDRALEPVFSTLRVEDEAGRRVDADDMHAPEGQNNTLKVHLLPLAGGRYHVYWSAVARDGHRTRGDYVFTVIKSLP